VYGSKQSFEWSLIEGEEPVMHTAKLPEHEIARKVKVPDFAKLLPEPIQRFTTKGVYDDENQHLSFAQGGGHGGSHPHLVHEFVSSIIENRPSFPDVYQSLNWTCAGLCAHESATRNGEVIQVPNFRR
ncbi:MAG: gfo/Idh/MocA family oxidoreductase, partial [Verrucomicrobiota bacterium]